MPTGPTTLTQAFSVQDIGTGDFFRFEFPVEVPANLAISVSWTPVESDVDVFLEPGLCFSQPATCPNDNPILASGTSETANPETASANVAAGNYTITLLNFVVGTATGTITVTITPT